MYALVAPKYAQKLRQKMCSDCAYLDEKTNRCGKCRCFVSLKIKVARASCPIHRWGEVRD